MGESGGVESLMRFKTRFGATPRDLPGYRFEPPAVSAVIRPARVLRQRAEQTALEIARRLRAGSPADSTGVGNATVE
jgi:hypothetical protein